VSAETKEGTGDEAGSAEGASNPTADQMPGQPQDRQPAHEGPIEAASKPREHRPERRIREDAVVSQGESARAEPRPDGSSAEASTTSERIAPIVHEAPASEPTAPSRQEASASEPTATMPRPAPGAEAAPPAPADSSAGAGAHQHASEGVRRETNASADTDDRSTPRPEPVAPAVAAASDPVEPKSGA
jgi:ribonuclease E